MCELQEQDPAINRLKHYYKIGKRPTKIELQNESSETLRLLREWDKIVEKNSILYRKDLTKNGSVVHQLILPEILREEILVHLHDNSDH